MNQPRDEMDLMKSGHAVSVFCLSPMAQGLQHPPSSWRYQQQAADIAHEKHIGGICPLSRCPGNTGAGRSKDGENFTRTIGGADQALRISDEHLSLIQSKWTRFLLPLAATRSGSVFCSIDEPPLKKSDFQVLTAAASVDRTKNTKDCSAGHNISTVT